MVESRKGISGEMASYKTLHLLSEKILMFAEKGDWDRSIVIEQQRQGLIQTLQNDQKKETLSKKDEELKGTLIHKILAVDDQTRHFLAEKMTGLKNQFEGGQKMVKAYAGH